MRSVLYILDLISATAIKCRKLFLSSIRSRRGRDLFDIYICISTELIQVYSLQQTPQCRHNKSAARGRRPPRLL